MIHAQHHGRTYDVTGHLVVDAHTHLLDRRRFAGRTVRTGQDATGRAQTLRRLFAQLSAGGSAHKTNRVLSIMEWRVRHTVNQSPRIIYSLHGTYLRFQGFC